MTGRNPAAVGVIGLGAMGAPMARNLARAGCLRGVWNRTPERARDVAGETGALAAETACGLARECDLLLLSVSGDADLLDVVEAVAGGVRPGTIVVDTSTVAVDTARAAAERLAACGAHFLDAPVSGGVEGAAKGSLAMMVGGDAQALSRARPVLDAVAARIVHLGAVGSGQAAKAVNQIMAAGINQAVTEALAFGEAMGLPMDRVVELVEGGAAGNWFLSHRGRSMLGGKFAPGFRVALHRKDLLLCKEMAQRQGAQLPVVEMTLIHYKRLIAEGRGDEDISALFRLKQRLFQEDQ